MMHRRSGLTMLELIVVLALIGLLASLLFPAVQSVREKAREATCKNHLHQMNVAIAGYFEAHKRLPGPPVPGMIGGWTVDILPYLEQSNLADSIKPGTTIANAEASLLQPPQVMRCPSRLNPPQPQPAMSSAHYVLVPTSRRQSFMLSDSPTLLTEPWANSPEMKHEDLLQATGPHHGGLFYVSGFQQGAGMLLKGQTIQAP